MNINEAFPSNYLKAEDLKGKEPNVTISHVSMEKMGDDNKMVLYFRNSEKGMVLNKTNAMNIAAWYGPETDDWEGKRVKLVVAWVDFQGRSVQALRVRPADNGNGQSAPMVTSGGQRNAPPSQPAHADLDDEIPF